ncbi:hypothetical protein [Lacticaseibacillus pantheris]|uniref:hypothetical protein n=1 Tax=Lacticaseibacillus pantheris TaxID=171523 RepID=UPI00265AC219|nr:hypothetical protein [Lacticaseibacillus pantheris]WKF84608.1 hypothetical protein QY874_10040 [Lacticaseibacillus pantheris]
MKYIAYIALLLLTVFLSPMLSSLVPQYSLWWWVIVVVYLLIIGAVYAAIENGSRKR